MNITENGMNIASNMQVNSYRQGESTYSNNVSSATMQQNIQESNEQKNIEEQKQELSQLAQQLNKELSPLNTSIAFNFSEDIEGLYITVSERDTNRLIRKIPSDEAMQLAAKMKEIVGMIFDKQA
ncbi:flagellar protein FlaG [Helicobacter pullorum]|uniref:flagellar protein FlaG n=1 Tax=Helicobacter pullorum TaxID=35818 RepID=UPI00241EBEA2|nr:flagellar protein FlaG [Helicobacter pullorum]